ncbi:MULTISPECIES: hypothetical protein [Actinosynnema]|uniref:hypothetical protein n=1 Tax=Actinosynnema TaxID=40566 RepID=UPI0020A2D0B6|nr:hypothetical protein [Actinosynnema pretiosum]
MTTNPDHDRTGSQLVGALVVAVLSALSWFAWFGWDTERDLSPDGLTLTGPYQVWQGVGCAVCLLVVLVGAVVLRGVRPWFAAAGTTVGFTLGFTVSAAIISDDGLFVIGSVLAFVGAAVCSALVAFGARAFARRDEVAPGP